MTGRLLLDTNIIVGIFANELAILQHLAKAEVVFVPCIALGELYFGARKSARSIANIARIDEFSASVSILDCDAAVAQEYGRLKNELRLKGRPIPENDIWIAAIAIRHGLAVVTRDHHFNEISELPIEVW